MYGPDASLNVLPVLVTGGSITGGDTYTTSLTVDTTGVGGPVQFGTIIATYPGSSDSGVSVALDSGNANYSVARSTRFAGYFSTYSTAGSTYINYPLTEAGIYSDLTTPNTYDLLTFYDGASTDASGNAAAGAAAVPIGTTGSLINFADETSNGVTSGTFLASVPEPAAVGLLALGGLLILCGRRGRRE
ncbi:MAG: PEP-CTERM sorting domain-containing protein [Phycisphaerae bacterium]|nr:PEP-CTERM sorting domain-containing protein [Phycisphaerae bacterium]